MFAICEAGHARLGGELLDDPVDRPQDLLDTVAVEVDNAGHLHAVDAGLEVVADLSKVDATGDMAPRSPCGRE
jgi:hypothetical protein